MNGDERPKTEPSADLRTLAATCWQTFIALRDEGFTDTQALTIIGQMLIAARGSGSSDG